MGTIETLLKIKADVSQAVRGLKPLQTSLDETGASAQKTEVALSGLDGTHKISLNDQAIQSAQAEITRLRAQMRDSLALNVNADTSAAQKQIKTLDAKIKVLQKEQPTVEVGVSADTTGLDSLRSELDNIRSGAIGAGAAFAGWKLVKLAADVETAKISLASLTGSAQDGAKAFADLQKFAATTPFELGGVLSAAQRLLGAGVDQSKLPQILTDIGNAAATMHEPIEEVAAILGQMFLKGKVSNEEMLQLAEHNIPAFKALADAMGISVAELQNMAANGELGADKIDLLVHALGQIDPEAMNKQAASFNGQMSTLGDNLKQIGGELGNIVLPQMTGLLSTFNDILGPTAQFIGLFEKLPGPVKDAAGDLILVTSVVSSAAFFGPKIIGAIKATTSALDALGGASVVVGNKLKALQAGAEVAAIAVAVKGIDAATQHFNDTRFDPSHIDREMQHLIDTGTATGEMAKTFGENFQGVGKDVADVNSKLLKIEDWIPIPFADSPVKDAKDNIQALDEQLAQMVEGGDAKGAAKVMKMITDAAADQGQSLKDTIKLFPQYKTAVDNAKSAADDEAAATKVSADQHWFAADAVKEHADRMQTLADRVQETSDKYQELKDNFDAFNDEIVNRRNDVYAYQGAIDDLTASFDSNPSFAPGSEEGRKNWENLTALAEIASDRIWTTYKNKGAGAAAAQAKGFRETWIKMLTDAGVEPKRAKQLVDDAFKTPVQIKLELGKINLADWRKKKANLMNRKELLLEPVISAITPRAADELSIDAQKKIKPIDAKINVANQHIGQVKDELDKTANPKGKPRKAHITASVDSASVAEANRVMGTITNPTIPWTAKVKVQVVPPRLLGGLLTPGGGIVTPSGALAPAQPAPAVATPALHRVPSSEPVTPQRTPVKVYIDGQEVASRVAQIQYLAGKTVAQRYARAHGRSA